MGADMLEEKILNDYRETLKARDALKISILRLLRAEIMNTAIAKKKNKLDDTEITSVIRKQIKQHQDSIEQFTKGMRQELADKENKELEVLKTYLPPEFSQDEISKIIDEAAAATNAQGIKDMGRLIKEVNLKIAGHADPKIVSDMVRAKLSGSAPQA